MSVQFGKCNVDGKPVDPQDLDEVRPVLAPYGPDGEGYICKDNFAVLYRAFHTTKESRHEFQPHICLSGMVITWDGRLDNRKELVGLLAPKTPVASTDLEIVAAAYESWGTDSLARLIGDWALTIWEPGTQSLLLAKDFLGTRHLYYSTEKNQVTWCTILDPLVRFAGHSFKLEEEYIAGWLSFFPATHLTPYTGIHAVPPSSFVRFTRGSHQVRKYWDFDPAKRIRYGTDGEYEEHFRFVFEQSVQRRLRSDSPIMAELSGGMDSSSIVCVADQLTVHGSLSAPPLKTISYFNEQEPNWDESAYFTLVERKRACPGWHIDLSMQTLAGLCSKTDSFISAPGVLGSSDRTAAEFEKCMDSQHCRVLLSGIGGDEVTGGIPTPTPHITDLLATLQVRRLAHELKTWALQKRTPWFYLLFEALVEFLPRFLSGVPKSRRPASWLQPSFRKRYWKTLTGYEPRVRFFGALPSFQQNLSTLDALRRQLGTVPLSISPLNEKRYPYLDRDFLGFMYGIPRTQVIRPGQRRSLMRRALREIVPAEILDRRRKAYLARSPLAMIFSDPATVEIITSRMESASLGVIVPAAFLENLDRARRGQELHIVSALRTIFMEVWLKSLRSQASFSIAPDDSGDHRGLWFRNAISRETT
jgi:asparagine synthase (glutamine-hydrolysing)